MNRWFSLFCFLLSISQLALAQEFRYQNFDELSGLPSSETYQVFQDSKGFIWVATDRGVSRYDGGEFKNFSIRDGLSDNTVFGFFEDYQNRIWFRTYSGALSYFQNDSIHHYEHNAILTRELGRSRPDGAPSMARLERKCSQRCRALLGAPNEPATED